jgi:SAM-dependent methyltransferase
MPRPPDTSRPRYLAAALLDRASAVRPVFRAREIVRAAQMPDPAQPAPDGLPYPPARLRVRVMGGDAQRFFAGGRIAADAIRAGLDRAGARTGDFGSVLDFGCGCGRVARLFKDEPWTLRGCDYNPAGVEWCQRHLTFMDAAVNGLEPPAPYGNDEFDLLYAVSVLTHLPDALGRAWIGEWRRLLRPGGLLVVTTLGDSSAGSQLNLRQRQLYEGGQPVVTKGRLAGMNACVAHHPSSYVTDTLLGGLDVLAAVPGVATGGFLQDLYVARVP